MKKYPFIKLFTTLNGTYFYDINKNDIVEISPDCYQYLSRLEESNSVLTIQDNSPDEIKDLFSQGYLSNHRFEIIEHPLTDELENILNRRMQKITLQVTQNCNLRCSYCHYTSNDGSQRNHSNRSIDILTAKKALLFLRDHSIDTQDIYIGFYGGEPLLEMRLIKELVTFAENIFFGKQINYMMTTNATLLNEEIIGFLEEKDFNLVISLDGPRNVHNKNRVYSDGSGTFDTVIEKLQYLIKKHKKYIHKISVNMVLDPNQDFDNINRLFTKYRIVNQIEIMSTIIDDESALKRNIFAEEFNSKLKYHEFLAYLCVLNKLKLDNLSPIVRPNVGKCLENVGKLGNKGQLPSKLVPGGPCVPGENRLMVTVEGKLIVCERVNEISECMIMGDIEQGIDLQKAKALLNIAKLTEEDCRECWAFWGCTLCGKYCDSNGKLTKERRLMNCEKAGRVFERILREKAILMEASKYYGQISVL